MKLSFVHLSDIHIKEDAAQNPILTRSEKIGMCIRSKLEEDQARAVIICISGDIAATGLHAEYTHAKKMADQISATISKSQLDLDIHWVTCPGNHDCNFRADTAVRRRILSHDEEGILADSSIINTCTSIQEEYFQFANGLNHWRGIKQRRLFDCHEVKIDDMLVAIYLVNTAWVSQKKEKQGELWFPRDLIKPTCSTSTYNLAVTMFHHPYNWMTEVNGKAIRRKIEEISDVIITGHEHDGELSARRDPQGGKYTYLEGDVLQDSHRPALSSFYYISFNLLTKAHYVDRCKWDSTRKIYLPKRYSTDLFEVNPRREKDEIRLSRKFQEYLQDPGAGLLHPRCEKLTLSNIYVFPDFQELRFGDEDAEYDLIRGEQVLKWITDKKHVLISGADRSGKTALAKRVFSAFYQQGLNPILVSGDDLAAVPIANLTTKIREVFSKQYDAQVYEKYTQLPSSQKVLIIDDYEKLGVDISRRNEVVSQIEHLFCTVVLLGPQELKFCESMRPTEASALLDYSHASIMELGFEKRSEIVRKWHDLGVVSGVVAENRTKLAMKIEKTVSEVLGQGLVPSYPIFVLIFLQQLEAGTSVDTSAGSFGYLYSSLVISNLSRVSSKMSDIDIYENVLAELAHNMFKMRDSKLTFDEIYDWVKRFNIDYALDLDPRKLVGSLIDCDILLLSDEVITFRYRYLYYFFVAKAMSNNIASPSIRTEVSLLAKKLYVEENANIMLFLCYFSRDHFVLSEVLDFARSLFSTYEPCDLGDRKLVEGIFADKTPQRDLDVSDDPGESVQARAELRRAKDQQDLQRRSENIQTSEIDLVNCQEDEEEMIDFALKINVAYKTIQILGQALRNHPGSLRGTRKAEITKECYSLGLRSMSFFFSMLRDDESDFYEGMKDFLASRHGEMLESERRNLANKVLYGMIEFFSYSVVRYISESVGSEELTQTYKGVLCEMKGASPNLIDLAIKLDNKPTFPEKTVVSLSKSLRKYYLPHSILQRLVWFHFYRFEEKRSVRQRVCEKLGLRFGLHPKKLKVGHSR